MRVPSLHSRPTSPLPPTTRYQGSKRKLLPWLWQHLQPFAFQTVLDAFGGTGAVSYYLKAQGKSVTYNDYLRFNHAIGLALIENSHTQLLPHEVDQLLIPNSHVCYQQFITKTFHDIYFTDAENQWLDMVVQNITHCLTGFARSIAYYALFQACLIKRPYNLFHRRNLYMRTAKVARSFGNKATWDRSFEHYFRQFVNEANQALLPGNNCRALCGDALEIKEKFDLVYLDPPYISAKGQAVDYQQFYHFLEGLTDYAGWSQRIDYERKHLPLLSTTSPWHHAQHNLIAFSQLFAQHADSILAVSYRSDGLPTAQQLVDALKQVKQHVVVYDDLAYQYALSTNRKSRELLIVGW